MRRGTNQAGKKASRKNDLKFKGRFSSAASLQSALKLNRKEAFDNESHMMMSETTDGNMTFMTSTTDYLRGGGRDAKSRNLDASFDESDTTNESRGKEPVAALSLFKSRSQGTVSPREKKRLQEREWERDRHRKSTAEPITSRNKLSSRHTNGAFVGFGRYNKGEDENESDSDYEQNLQQPRSSRQLRTTPTVKNSMARDGYDSDTYSMKASRQKKLGKSRRISPTKRRTTMDESHAESSGYNQFRSLLEDTTTNMSDTFAPSTFAPSTAIDTKTDGSAGDSFLQESAGKIKMTKMDKIKQLQAKNERYKEEYKKTYLEKKEFKKKYEDKKMEVASLSSEIESYMKETALLKKQLHQLTSEMENASNSSRKDSAKVAELQKELQETRADLKEALSRIADRRMEKGHLQESMIRKDEQIESLTLEVSRQIEEVQRLQAQISLQDHDSISSAGSQEKREADEQVEELKQENEGMKAELSMTLARAAEMVKNREGQIEILRKENHELKELLDIRDQDDDRTTSSEKIQRKEEIIEELRTELAGLQELYDHSISGKNGLKQAIQNRELEMKHVKTDVDGLKKMVKRAEKEATKAKKEVEQKDATIASLKDDVLDHKNHSKEAARHVEEMHKAVESRDVEIRQLHVKVKTLKESQDGSSEQLGVLKVRLGEKEEEMKELYRENEDLKADLLQQREELDERRKALVLELEATRLREKDLQDQVEESDSMVKQRDDAISDLLKEVEKLKKNRDVIDSNHSEEINKHTKSMVELMGQMDLLKAQMNEREEQLAHTREMVKEREVAIDDLLRDIEALKRDGSDLEKRVNTRTDKLKKEIKKKNDEIHRLEVDVEDLSQRLEEALKSLESKHAKLQEREEEVEELLKDVNEMKSLHAEEMRDTMQADKRAGTDKDMLKRELHAAKKQIKENEEKLRHIVKENVELKDTLEAVKIEKDEMEKEKQDDDEEGDSKSYLVAQHEVLEEEIQQLNEQVNELQEELEEVLRQNAIMNEEVEDWVQRGGNFELEIQRLRNEIEGWEGRAEELKAAAGGTGKDDAGDQQAMMLEKAMAEKQRKAEGGGKGVWGLLFNQSEEGEELTEEQKRIRELEAIKDAQAEELQKVKSDLVKLTTSSRNESYMSKKRLSDLEEENEGYKAKVEILLRRLAEVQGVPYGNDEGYEAGDEKKTDDPHVVDEAPSSLFRMNLLA